MELDKCFIGAQKENDECHKTWYTKQQELLPIKELKRNELKL